MVFQPNALGTRVSVVVTQCEHAAARALDALPLLGETRLVVLRDALDMQVIAGVGGENRSAWRRRGNATWNRPR